MDILDLAKDLGAQLQKDERYLNYENAKKENDMDKELQDLIGDFNLKRIAVEKEMSETEPNKEKLDQLNGELNAVYEKVMSNSSMAAFNEAKVVLDDLIRKISTIVVNAANGEDPYADPVESGCSGSCESCGGCH